MFGNLGLAPGETEVYVAVVGNPRSSAEELAGIARLTRVQTGRALARLTDRGMVSRMPGRPHRFLAAAPDVAVGELIRAAESELRQSHDAVQHLMEVHRAASRYTHPDQSLEVLIGRDAIGKRMAYMQAIAKIQVRGFDKPPYVSAPGGNLENEGRRLRQGIRFRVVYTREAVAWPDRLRQDIMAALREGEQARVRPDLPLKMFMIDDRMALIPVSSAEQNVDAAYVIHPSSLLDALITLFKAEWDRGMPLSVDGLPADGSNAEAETRELLTLLASGLTEHGIARSLGWSPRTTQRRIHSLMQDLGVTTRFQMGMAAQARGWL